MVGFLSVCDRLGLVSMRDVNGSRSCTDNNQVCISQCSESRDHCTVVERTGGAGPSRHACDWTTVLGKVGFNCKGPPLY